MAAIAGVAPPAIVPPPPPTFADNVCRVAKVAAPFLMLHGPLRRPVAVIQGMVGTTNTIMDMREHGVTAAGVARTAALVTTVTATIFMPPVGALIFTTHCLAEEGYLFGLACWNHEGGKALLQGAKTLSEILSLYLFFTFALEVMVVSYALSILLKLHKGSDEWSQEHWLEAAAALAMIGVHCHKARPHAGRLYRNHFGEKLTQDKLSALFLEIHQSPSKKVELEELLAEKNYSSNIEGVSFADKNVSLSFKNIRLLNCDFQKANLNGSSFEKVDFEKCRLDEANLIHSIFINTMMRQCSMKDTSFNSSLLHNVKFIDSAMDQAVFNDALLDRVNFVACRLFETCFMGAKVIESSIKDSDLTDCLLLDAAKKFEISGGQPHKMTRPVAGILWDFENRGVFAQLAKDKLRDENLISLRMEYHPEEIDPNRLEEEVQQALKEIGSHPGIPQRLLESAREGSEISHLRERAKEAMRYIDLLAIPGGNDIEPELYGKAREEHTHTENDYRRSLFELTLLQEAHDHKVPTWGVCHGAQMVNVFYGGTLRQDVEGHWGAYHLLQVPVERTDPLSMQLRDIIGDRILGLSMHHQAIDQLGEGLTVLLEADGVPKALMSHDRPILLTQFHPEISYYFSKDAGVIEEAGTFLYEKYKNDPTSSGGELEKSHFIAGLQQNDSVMKYLVDCAWEHKVALA